MDKDISQDILIAFGRHIGMTMLELEAVVRGVVEMMEEADTTSLLDQLEYTAQKYDKSTIFIGAAMYASLIDAYCTNELLYTDAEDEQ